MFAAAIPVCGRFPSDQAERITDIPVWCFHGEKDPTINAQFSRNAYATMKKLGGNMKYTELAGVGHNAWVQAFEYKGDDPANGCVTHYATDRCDRTPDVWQWLFAQRKGK